MKRDASAALVEQPAQHAERLALVWQRSDGAPVEFTVWAERPMTIGRDPTNTITLESPFISKAHAIFQYDRGQYTLEDLKSANGTRVNGVPVSVSVVTPGDVIEIGDQRLLFIDRAARGASVAPKLGKNARLMIAAVGTMVLTGGLMMLLVRSGSAPSPAQSAPAPAPQRPAAAPAATAAPPTGDVMSDALVREVLARAQRAGVNPADALYDEALLLQRAGRLRDASRLLAAVLVQNAGHELAKSRLATVRQDLEQALATQVAEAERAQAQLRYADAVRAWEQVMLLADEADPRYRIAEQRAAEARRLVSR